MKLMWRHKLEVMSFESGVLSMYPTLMTNNLKLDTKDIS
jgi:hypothetical protein